MIDVDARHRALLQTLVDNGVHFVLVGVALQIHGYSGATRDVDITIATDPANRARVESVLRALNAREYLAGTRGTAYDTRLGRLEVMTTTDGVGDYAAWRQGARPVALAPGIEVLVGAASDLLRSKEAAARGKDLDVLPRLRAELLAAGALDVSDVRGPVAASEHEPAPDPAAESLLGARPEARRARALWDRGANLLSEYRQRWDVADDESLLPPDADTDRGRDFAALRRQLDRLARLIGRS